MEPRREKYLNTWINSVGSISDIPTGSRSNYSFIDWNMDPPCDIRTTIDHTLNASFRLFNDEPEASPLVLFGDRDDASGDCTSVETLFESWETLWSCLTLAGLSLASRNFTRYFDPGESRSDVLENGYNYTEARDALESQGLNLSSIADFDALIVFNLTFSCAEASCQRWEGEGACSLTYPSEALNSNGSGATWGPLLSEALHSVCDDLQILNYDMAGPGVLISYSIQTISVIALWGMLHLVLYKKAYDSIMTFLCLAVFSLPATDRHPVPRLESLLRRFEKSNFVQSTITLVVDLQEAQCFFLIAVQIAILFATNQGNTSDATSTKFGAEQNRTAAYDLAALGSMLVCIVQSTLCRLRVDSTYTLLLATATVGLATATMKRGFSGEHVSDAASSFQESLAVEACGNYRSLRYECQGGTIFAGFTSGTAREANSLIPLTAVGLVFVWTIKIWRELSNRGVIRNSKRYRGLSNHDSEILDVWLAVGAGMGLWILEFMWVMNVVSSLYDLLDQAKGGGEDPNDEQPWNIGQILALLIWAPVLLRYLYVLIRGIEMGFRWRFSELFEVRRKPQASQTNQATPDSGAGYSALINQFPSSHQDSLTDQNPLTDQDSLLETGSFH